jgi:hypothetical protein
MRYVWPAVAWKIARPYERVSETSVSDPTAFPV